MEGRSGGGIAEDGFGALCTGSLFQPRQSPLSPRLFIELPLALRLGCNKSVQTLLTTSLPESLAQDNRVTDIYKHLYLLNKHPPWLSGSDTESFSLSLFSSFGRAPPGISTHSFLFHVVTPLHTAVPSWPLALPGAQVHNSDLSIPLSRLIAPLSHF